MKVSICNNEEDVTVEQVTMEYFSDFNQKLTSLLEELVQREREMLEKLDTLLLQFSSLQQPVIESESDIKRQNVFITQNGRGCSVKSEE